MITKMTNEKDQVIIARCCKDAKKKMEMFKIEHELNNWQDVFMELLTHYVPRKSI